MILENKGVSMGIFRKIGDVLSGYDAWKKGVDLKSAPARVRSAVQKAEKESREAAAKKCLADEVAKQDEQKKLHLEEAKKISQWVMRKLESGSGNVSIASRQASRKKRGGGDGSTLAPKFLRFELGSIVLEMKNLTGEIIARPGDLQLEVKDGDKRVFFAQCVVLSTEDDLFSVLYELYSKLRESGVALDEDGRARTINRLFQ